MTQARTERWLARHGSVDRGGTPLPRVIRRPVVADDVESLVDGALLRREDALRVVQPFPAVAAVVAGVNSEGDLALFGFLGYALAALAAWTFAYGVATHARVGGPPAVPDHRARPAA